jgi:hypothetical protein
MNTYTVSCINKSDRPSRHEAIRRIGGGSGSSRWTKSQEDAIREIESNTSEFKVVVDGKSVKVIVAKSAYGNKYLKTEADSTTRDNLLSLPECN